MFPAKSFVGEKRDVYLDVSLQRRAIARKDSISSLKLREFPHPFGTLFNTAYAALYSDLIGTLVKRKWKGYDCKWVDPFIVSLNSIFLPVYRFEYTFQPVCLVHYQDL